MNSYDTRSPFRMHYLDWIRKKFALIKISSNKHICGAVRLIKCETEKVKIKNSILFIKGGVRICYVLRMRMRRSENFDIHLLLRSEKREGEKKSKSNLYIVREERNAIDLCTNVWPDMVMTNSYRHIAMPILAKATKQRNGAQLQCNRLCLLRFLLNEIDKVYINILFRSIRVQCQSQE